MASDRQQATSPPTGVLLVGHGTTDPDGRAEFLQLSLMLDNALPEMVVEPAFLELAEPDIPTAMSELAARGVRRAVVAPCLLFAAGHAKVDIPTAVQSAALKHHIKTFMARPLGVDLRLIRVCDRIVRQAGARLDPKAAQQTQLIMVGRGSSDIQAQAAMRQFVEVRNRHGDFRVDNVCFLAKAHPQLAELLDETPSLADCDDLLIQPHLLFAGRLTQQIDDILLEWQNNRPAQFRHIRVLRLPHIGPQLEVAEVLVDRISAAIKAMNDAAG